MVIIGLVVELVVVRHRLMMTLVNLDQVLAKAIQLHLPHPCLVH